MSWGPTGGVGSVERLRGLPAVALGVLGVALAGLVVAFISVGMWYLSVVVLVAGPAFYLLNRYPFVGVMVWVAIAPLLMAGEGGVERRIYWLIHRALPVGTLLVILVARWIGVRKDRFPKLGWPEAMIGGYLLLTVISIAYRSLDTVATYIYMYDHVLVPLCVYMLVRLLAPKDEDFRRMMPVIVFLLISQALIGALGWIAPEVLPGSWNNRESRATGTLRHPNVYGVTLLFAGLYLAHYGQQVRDRPGLRRVTLLLFGGAVVMAVATLSRATWLATFVVLAGMLLIYRRPTRRLLVGLAAPVLVVGLLGGVFSDAAQVLGQRLFSETSEESALARLPVVVASLRMIENRPLFGWGYENFDRYDQSFQSSIQGLYVPDKDHASHNLFLTLGAESGLIGLFLYIGPALWWLARSPSGMRHLPSSGFRSRKLVQILWLALAAQVIVYNFSNLRVAFGLGVWWLTVGLLATACDWRDDVADEAEKDVERRIAVLRSRQDGSRP
ncbi:MAG: O-antigen ligase family protein [Actinomycetota bacterium]